MNRQGMNKKETTLRVKLPPFGGYGLHVAVVRTASARGSKAGVEWHSAPGALPRVPSDGQMEVSREKAMYDAV